jgi:hypothetical protein
MSATTSRCRGVRPASLWVVIVIMAPEASEARSLDPFLRRCKTGCNFRLETGFADRTTRTEG